jgi:hypothetical protein
MIAKEHANMSIPAFSYMQRSSILIKMVGVFSAVLVTTGCKESFQPYFSLTGGVYDTEQQVSVKVSSDTTNLYLTTDGVDPVVDPRCAYNGEPVVIDRPTRVKLRYDQNGKTGIIEDTFIVKQNMVDSGYTNRKIVEVWERFFVDHVLNAFDPPSNENSLFSLDEENGSQLLVETNILSRTPITKIPDAGEQSYRFRFFERTSEDTGEQVRINRGAVYGYRNKNGGYYTTYPTKASADGEPMSERLYFSGTYTGWAEGSFRMNTEGVTTTGYYEVECVGENCAPSPVRYQMIDGSNLLIEVGPARHAHTRSCTAPSEDGEVQ